MIKKATKKTLENYARRTKAQLLTYIESLEKENERLTNQRNNATNALSSYKAVMALVERDDIDSSAVSIIKKVVELAAKIKQY